MKAQQAGCLVPSSTFGPLHCIPPGFNSRLIAAVNGAMESVHSAMMPFLSLCHLVVTLPTVNLILSASICEITSPTTLVVIQCLLDPAGVGHLDRLWQGPAK